MEDVERSFLKYTWDLARRKHEVGTHCAVGTFRWPGYLGSNYRHGGILFIGTIHNPNEVFPSRSASAASGMRTLSSKLTEWSKLDSERAMADAETLTLLRDCYLSAIKYWIEFPVWSMFDRLRAIANAEWEDVAFTNIAKCAGTTAWAASCAKTFPLNDLVTLLNPGIVMICNDDKAVRRSTLLDCERSAKESRIFVRRFPNSTRPYPNKPSWGEVLNEFREHFEPNSR